jgi:hypothetical protein
MLKTNFEIFFHREDNMNITKNEANAMYLI